MMLRADKPSQGALAKQFEHRLVYYVPSITSVCPPKNSVLIDAAMFCA